MKKFAVLICILLTVSSVCAVEHVRWSSRNTPLNGLTVSWSSDEESNTIRWGVTPRYEKGSFKPGREDNYREGKYVFSYTFPSPLDPATTLYYEILEKGRVVVAKMFRTASTDDGSSKFSFIVGGDSRSKYKYTEPVAWGGVASVLKTLRPDFWLYSGDIAYYGGLEGNRDGKLHYDNWYEYGEEFIESALIYHCYGNHDQGPIYPVQFPQPNVEPAKYYSFEKGNTLFIALDSQAASDEKQYAWLVDTLENHSKTWVVIWFHKPFFTGSKHPDDMDEYRDTWWKAFDDFGVDVVLGGHCHNYMRSKPINLNMSDSVSVSRYGDGPGEGRLQIVGGGFGAPLSAPSVGWFVEKTARAYHYSLFEMDGDTLNYTAVRTDNGEVIDRLTLTKNGAWANKDSTPPVITDIPRLNLLRLPEVQLRLSTDENAMIRWDTSDGSFWDMKRSFEYGEGSRKHSTTFTGEYGKDYTIYVQARDVAGNVTKTAQAISFTILPEGSPPVANPLPDGQRREILGIRNMKYFVRFKVCTENLPTRLNVYDADGHFVRELNWEPTTNPVKNINWDRLDSEENPVRPGKYFVGLIAEGFEDYQAFELIHGKEF